MDEKNKELLDGIQSQIASFDNKASILLSIVGIVFALALSILNVFQSELYNAQSVSFQKAFLVLFILFIVASVLAIASFAWVIVPRKHHSKNKYPNYYADVCKMDDQELRTTVKEYFEKDTLILEQMKINSEICLKKHKLISLGYVFLFSFITLITVLSIMTIMM